MSKKTPAQIAYSYVEIALAATNYAQTCLELHTPFETHVNDFINGVLWANTKQSK